ncbi:hypothetical protein BGZ96_000441 [Linnemannia gamsii]|uniref:Uncharacterized protein n=1 Tax=Linnemannia gamsii TaxID=64522 RepID=A0ABQ7KBT7_9FUNG|nr:hypothetical protein BGZ96_000441 [Linnemannia gamsii]
MNNNSQNLGNTQCHRRRFNNNNRSATSPTISALQQAASVASLGFQNHQQQQQSLENSYVYQEPHAPPVMNSKVDVDVEMFQRRDIEDEDTVPSEFSGQVGRPVHEHYQQQGQRVPGFSVSRVVLSPSVPASKPLQTALTPSNYFGHPFEMNPSVPSVISNNVGVWTGCSSEDPALFDYQGLSHSTTTTDYRTEANNRPHPMFQSTPRPDQQQQQGGADPSIAWLTATNSPKPRFDQSAYGFNTGHLGQSSTGPTSFSLSPNDYNYADDTIPTTHDDYQFSEHKAALSESTKHKFNRIRQKAPLREQQQQRFHAIQQQQRHRRYKSSSFSATDSGREVDDITSDEDRCRTVLAQPFLRRPRRSHSSLDQYMSRKVRGATRRAMRGLWGPKYIVPKATRRHRLSNETDMDKGRTYQRPKRSTSLEVSPTSPSSSSSLEVFHEYFARVAAFAVKKPPHCKEEARKVYDLQRMLSALHQVRHESFVHRLDEEAVHDNSVPFAADQEGHNTVFGSGLTPAEWLDAQRWMFSPTEDPLMVFMMQIPNKPSGGDEEGGGVPVTTSSSTSGVNVDASSEEPATITSTPTAVETTTSSSTQYFSADEEVTQIFAAAATGSGSQHTVTGPSVVQEPLTARDSHTFRKEIKAREKKAKAEREQQQAAVREAQAAAVSDVIQGEGDQLLAERRDEKSNLAEEREVPHRTAHASTSSSVFSHSSLSISKSLLSFSCKRADVEEHEENKDEQQQQHKDGNEQQQDKDNNNAGEGSSYGRRRKPQRELQIERDEALARQFQATQIPNRAIFNISRIIIDINLSSTTNQYILFVGFGGSAAPPEKHSSNGLIVILVVTINKLISIVIKDDDDCCY